MSGGSHDPEDARDVRCKNCGRCYRRDGIHGHEPNCELKGVDAFIVDPEEWEQPLDDPEGEAPPSVNGASPPADEGEGPPTPPEATTDGGTAGLGLSGPPEPLADVDADAEDLGDDDPAVEAHDGVEVIDELDCNDCGDPLGVGPGDLEDGERIDCDECGHTMRWSA